MFSKEAFVTGLIGGVTYIVVFYLLGMVSGTGNSITIRQPLKG